MSVSVSVSVSVSLSLSACATPAPSDDVLIDDRAAPKVASVDAREAPQVLSVADAPQECAGECARQRERALGYPRTPQQRDEALRALTARCRDGVEGACRVAKVVVPTGDPHVARSHELRFSLANRDGELMLEEVRCAMREGRLLGLDGLVHDLDYFAKRARSECFVDVETTIKIELSFESGQVMRLDAGVGASEETLGCVREAARGSKTSVDGQCTGALRLTRSAR